MRVCTVPARLVVSHRTVRQRVPRRWSSTRCRPSAAAGRTRPQSGGATAAPLQPDRDPVGGERRLRRAGREPQAALEAGPAAVVEQQVLRGAAHARRAGREPLELVDARGLGRERDAGDRVRRVRLEPALGEPDPEPARHDTTPAGAVDQRAQPSQPRRRELPWRPTGAHGAGGRDRVRVQGKAGGGDAARQQPPREQLRGHHARARRAAGLADRRDLADQERVAAVAGGGERAGGRADERAVAARRGRHAAGVELRRQPVGHVRLVPDRPQALRRIAPAELAHEPAERRGGGRACLSGAWPPTTGRRPCGARSGRRQQHVEAAGARRREHAVERGERAGRVRLARLPQRQRRCRVVAPDRHEPHSVHAERSHLVERVVAHHRAGPQQQRVVLHDRARRCVAGGERGGKRRGDGQGWHREPKRVGVGNVARRVDLPSSSCSPSPAAAAPRSAARRPATCASRPSRKGSRCHGRSPSCPTGAPSSPSGRAGSGCSRRMDR